MTPYQADRIAKWAFIEAGQEPDQRVIILCKSEEDWEEASRATWRYVCPGQGFSLVEMSKCGLANGSQVSVQMAEQHAADQMLTSDPPCERP